MKSIWMIWLVEFAVLVAFLAVMAVAQQWDETDAMRVGISYVGRT